MKVFGRDYIKTDVASSEPSQYEYQLSKASKDDIVVGKDTINRRDQVKYWGTNFHGDIRRHYTKSMGKRNLIMSSGGVKPVSDFSLTRTCKWRSRGPLAVTWQVGGAIRTIDCPTCQLTAN